MSFFNKHLEKENYKRCNLILNPYIKKIKPSVKKNISIKEDNK